MIDHLHSFRIPLTITNLTLGFSMSAVLQDVSLSSLSVPTPHWFGNRSEGNVSLSIWPSPVIKHATLLMALFVVYAIAACHLFLKKRYPDMSIGQMLLHTTPLCLTLDDIGFTQWKKHCCSTRSGRQWSDSGNGDQNVANFITALRHFLSFQIPIFLLSLLLFLLCLKSDHIFCTRWYNFDGYFEGDIVH